MNVLVKSYGAIWDKKLVLFIEGFPNTAVVAAIQWICSTIVLKCCISMVLQYNDTAVVDCCIAIDLQYYGLAVLLCCSSLVLK